MRAKAYIDASNLFYGGLKSLGWRIDYLKLFQYLKRKYNVNEVYYFGGVEIHTYYFDPLKEDTVPIEKLEKYLTDLIDPKSNSQELNTMISGYLKRVKFYLKLKEFGFKLILKPVKCYSAGDGEKMTRKANCDVDMTLRLMQDADMYDTAIVLSGDGDFLPVLKFLSIHSHKEIYVLANADRTAKEIKRFAKEKFLDFSYLREQISWIE